METVQRNSIVGHYPARKSQHLALGPPRQRPPMPYHKQIRYRRIYERILCQCPTIVQSRKHVVPQHHRNTPERDAKCRNLSPVPIKIINI